MACSSSSEEGAGRLKSLVALVLSKKDFALPSERCERLQVFGKLLLSSLSKAENSTAVDCFTKRMETLLNRALSEAVAEKSLAAQREKAWANFHRLRCTEIQELWKAFLLEQLGLKDHNNLLTQTVTQEFFELTMKTYYPSQLTRSQVILPAEELSADEKNALLYACGYVPVALLRKYKKRKDPKSLSYVECLLNMAIGAFEESFYDYCRKWFEEINRGGAFEVSDEAYNFFLAVEMNVRSSLTTLLQKGSSQATEDQKKTLLQNLSENEDILFYWSLISVDCDSSSELLAEILALWVTIRGCSIAGCWMEQYKRLSQDSSKATLRRGLKRKTMENES